MYEKEKSDIQTLKLHLRSLPPTLGLSSDSAAIKSAISGLDKELIRLEREEKLLNRFQAAAGSASGDVDMEYVKLKADASDGDLASSGLQEDEWTEAGDKPVDSSNLVGQKWTSAAIARISSSKIKVETALGALGLVLHAAVMELSSKNGRFRCTGVPSADVLSELSSTLTTAPKNYDGFAPPVRELPNGQLVPDKWEFSSRVAFRYKCARGETFYLVVEPSDDSIKVYFGPLPKYTKKMKFALDAHINLDGIKSALEKSSPASPTLFYKSLKELLWEFGREFSLMEAVHFTYGEKEDTGDVIVPGEAAFMSREVPPTVDRAAAESTKPSVDPLRVDTLHTGRRNRGDFEGDLLPGGPLPGPDVSHGPRVGGGSQVGPNHPLFDRTFGDDANHSYGDDLGYDESGPTFRVPGTGGLEMRPRFDPFGPPMGPTEPGRGLRGGRGRGGRGRGGLAPPGGFGYPNPDHMRPPGGDYFS
jgi:hypothetical protein